MRTVLAFLLLLGARRPGRCRPRKRPISPRAIGRLRALEQKWDSAAHDKAIGILTPSCGASSARRRRASRPGRDGARQPVLRGRLGQARRASRFGDAVVTTEGLARHWLGEKPKTAGRSRRQGQGRRGLYCGLTGDAAVTIYAALPIERPAGDRRRPLRISLLPSQSGAFSPPGEVGVDRAGKADGSSCTCDKAAVAPELAGLRSAAGGRAGQGQDGAGSAARSTRASPWRTRRRTPTSLLERARPRDRAPIPPWSSRRNASPTRSPADQAHSA